MRLILTLFKMYLFFVVIFLPFYIIEKLDISNDKLNFIIGAIISIALIYKLSKFILSIGRNTEESIF